MANEQYAFIEKAKVPSREAWQAAIDECGFDFQLDPELKPFEDSGFMPCKLNGADAGVEIYYDGSAEFLSQFSDIAQERDYCIAFRWGGSMIECASAMVACYALAKNFGAVVSYEGGEPEALESFLVNTKACIEDGMKDS